ncbi:MAG: 1-(5-phosphoribosyl)-5-[(5-phosphoribosylamino)methylideneamino]imidazole-4-carboxamide isomerase [Succinivibrio sp.]|jgi:phosphoribosylformimino-5-aminoimidazole carboxamide ribotide isomerase|nr:1-(5-phosphoribosyl)-5-[(5-phosphoribosylamino)methylideneamino]imidazole-4-carboxamide isomerase [Succinivibrio sp.]
MIIPALDLLNGRVVRLQQGDYARTTIFEADPVKKILDAAAQGAQFIHLVDLEGARAPEKRQLALIAQIVRSSPLPVETGGGIRSDFDVKNLLDLGVERVVVGSCAVTKPDMVAAWLCRFGPERFTLALDVRLEDGVPYVATHGWLETSKLTLDRALRHFLPYGIEHVLVTDISRDGMLSGANNALYQELSRRYHGLDIIASGGISSTDDIRAVLKAGASSVVLGRALLEGRFTVEEALRCSQNA